MPHNSSNIHCRRSATARVPPPSHAIFHCAVLLAFLFPSVIALRDVGIDHISRTGTEASGSTGLVVVNSSNNASLFLKNLLVLRDSGANGDNGQGSGASNCAQIFFLSSLTVKDLPILPIPNSAPYCDNHSIGGRYPAHVDLGCTCVLP